MKGDSQIALGWMVLRLFAAFFMPQIVTVSAVYNMDQTCAQISKSFIADPNNCKSFGYCENGILKGTSSCPDGYVYNARKATCEYPSANSCAVSNVTNVCNYAPDKSYVADPTDCNRYCYCNDRVAVFMNCPEGQMYDSKQIRCIWWDKSSNICAANSICRLVPDGTFAGDQANCGQYISCTNGIGTPGKCPENTYFNKQIGMCQRDNPCQTPTPVGMGLGIVVPLGSSPEACKAATKPDFPQYLGDGKTCMGYYVCNSKAGPGTWGKCSAGMHFNNGECVTPFTFGCTFDRCGNINQQFVGTVGSQCHNYLICKNQTSQGPSSFYTNYVGLACNNNQFFNEFTQRCEDTSPASTTYKLCV